MYKLKDLAKRGSALVGVVGLLAGITASAMPAMVSANALNPLTKRSLTLSSSSPGWDYFDGSGNTTYAPPNSGANGQKTGNTFQFDVSTDSSSGTPAINGLTFQYCTQPAGACTSPGNDAHGTGTGTITLTSGSSAVTGTGTTFTTQLGAGAVITTAGGHTYTVASVTDATDLVLATTATASESAVAFTYRGVDSIANQQSDLNIVTSTPTEVSSANYSTYINTDGTVASVPPASNSAGNFVVLTAPAGTSTWSYSGGWSMQSGNLEGSGTTIGAGTATGKNNYVQLLNDGTGTINLATGGQVKVIFFGTNTNYITNPGAGDFFVRLNDYSDTNTTTALADLQPTDSQYGTTQCTATDACIVDGGVTVANVMNQSIEIQTKVLETMDFSVGVVDPDTLSNTELSTATGGGLTAHGACDPILTSMTYGDPANVLYLGNQAASDSLSTTDSFATASFWRLSSNSSAGATVYYSGTTLSNTEGNQIAAIGATAAAPHTGTEQFGLALDNGTGAAGKYAVNYALATPDGTTATEYSAAQTAATGGAALSSSWNTYQTANSSTVHNPQLEPLTPTTNYGGGTGYINSLGGTQTINTQFAFDPNSETIPVAIASEPNTVVNCVTGKMRYIANIAATTPAGIYTTKINYIASPQY